MNYTELCQNIQDICETTFTSSQLEMFTKQAEQKIYNTVQLPVLRKTSTLLTVASNQLVTLPTDFLYVFSLAINPGTGSFSFLLDKDVNFIREAYPSPTYLGVPQHYAIYDSTKIILGPTPQLAYNLELNYGHYPLSISDPLSGGVTWLGDEFDSALLNGALIEAIRFMKGEADLVSMYEKLYVQAIGLLKVLGDGKLRQDAYRSGQYREKVS